MNNSNSNGSNGSNVDGNEAEGNNNDINNNSGEEDDDEDVEDDDNNDNESIGLNNSSTNLTAANDKISLQEMREKPLTLHNMKNANLASAKTEALIASLGLKANSLELKNRLTKKPFLNKKPLKKRLKGNFKIILNIFSQ